MEQPKQIPEEQIQVVDKEPVLNPKDCTYTHFYFITDDKKEFSDVKFMYRFDYATKKDYIQARQISSTSDGKTKIWGGSFFVSKEFWKVITSSHDNNIDLKIIIKFQDKYDYDVKIPQKYYENIKKHKTQYYFLASFNISGTFSTSKIILNQNVVESVVSILKNIFIIDTNSNFKKFETFYSQMKIASAKNYFVLDAVHFESFIALITKQFRSYSEPFIYSLAFLFFFDWMEVQKYVNWLNVYQMLSEHAACFGEIIKLSPEKWEFSADLMDIFIKLAINTSSFSYDENFLFKEIEKNWHENADKHHDFYVNKNCRLISKEIFDRAIKSKLVFKTYELSIILQSKETLSLRFLILTSDIEALIYCFNYLSRYYEKEKLLISETVDEVQMKVHKFKKMNPAERKKGLRILFQKLEGVNQILKNYLYMSKYLFENLQELFCEILNSDDSIQDFDFYTVCINWAFVNDTNILILMLKQNYTEQHVENIIDKLFPICLIDESQKKFVKTSLETIHGWYPEILRSKFELINQFIRTTKHWRLHEIFSIMEVSLEQLLSSKLDTLIIAIPDDDTSHSLLEYFIENSNPILQNKLISLNKINSWLDSSRNYPLKASFFCKYYSANKMLFYCDLNPEAAIKHVFNDFSENETRLYVSICQDRDLTQSQDVQKLIISFRIEFEKISNGEISVSRFQKLMKIDLKNSDLMKLYRLTAMGNPNELKLPKESFEKMTKNLNSIVSLIETIAKSSKDYNQFTATFDINSPKNQNRTINELLNDQFIFDHTKILRKIRAFLSTYDKSEELLARIRPEMTCTEVINYIIDFTKEYEAKIESIRQDYQSMTLSEIMDVFGIRKIEETTKSLSAYFIKENPRDLLILKAIEFAEKLILVNEYLNLFECFRKDLGFSVIDFDLKFKYIREFRKLDTKTSLMMDFEKLLNQFGSLFDPIDRVSTIVESLNYFKDFKEPNLFLNKISKSFERFHECVTDLNESEITSSHINDLETINQFIEEWRKEKYASMGNIEDEYNSKTINNRTYGDIKNKIENLNQNLNQFKEFDEYVSRGFESRLKWINSLMINSRVILHLSADDKEQVKSDLYIETGPLNSINEATDKPKFFEYDAFVEIKNTVSMKTKAFAEHNNQNLTFEERSKREFIYMVDQIISLNSDIKNLKVFKYPFPTKTLEFVINNFQFYELISMREDYAKKCTEIEDAIKHAHSNSFLLTLMHDDMFIKFERVMKKANPPKSDFHLLDYLGLTLTEEMRRDFKGAIKLIKHENKFIFLKDYFESILKSHSSINNVRFYSTIEGLKNDFVYIYEYKKFPRYLYHPLLFICLSANSEFPKHYNLMFCTQKTRRSEVVAFLYRLFICHNNQVFVLINPENLQHELQEDITKEYEYLLKEKNLRRSSILFIVHASPDSFLVSFFSAQKNNKAFVYKENPLLVEAFKKHFREFIDKVIIVRSRKVLSGKSYRIKSMIREYSQPKRSYQFIKLTGNIDLKLVYQGLLSIFEKDNVALHVEIGQVEENSVAKLDELLFSMVFLGCIRFETGVIMIPKNTIFYFEFDSSKFETVWDHLEFCNFAFRTINHKDDNEQFPPISPISFEFLSAFSRRKIDLFNQESIQDIMCPLNSYEDQMTADKNIALNPIQVMNRRLDDYTEDDMLLYKEWLLDYCAKNNPEYERCQLMLFEKIITFLAKSFTECGYFVNEQTKKNLLYETTVVNQNNIADIIIMSAFNLAKSAMDILRKEQTKQNDRLQHVHAENPSDNLSNIPENKTSWNSSNQFIIIFADGFPIFSYNKLEDVPRELRQIDKTGERFFDRQKMSHLEIFLELSNLNKQCFNCLFCEKCCRKFYKSSCPKCRSSTISLKTFDPRSLIQIFGKNIIAGDMSESYLKYRLSEIEPKSADIGDDLDISVMFEENSYIPRPNDNNNEIPFEKRQDLSDIQDREDEIMPENIPDPAIQKMEQFIHFLAECYDKKLTDKEKNNIETGIYCPNCRHFYEDVKSCLDCNSGLAYAQSYFEKNSHLEAFIDIDKKNTSKRRFKKPNLTSNDRFVLNIFESDINEEFLKYVGSKFETNYVLTPDNYVKMLNIYVRAKSRLPIVLMGETGCGKTSLVRFLCQNIIDDYFVLFNIHAGTTEVDIINKMDQFIKICEFNTDKDCWMVFDEFNTSDAYGLIKTIMIDRQLNGEYLPVNAIFIATCNPFKLKTKNTLDEECIGLNKNKLARNNNNYRLLYTVNPIPESLMLYTFDFGQLCEKDEALYIDSLIRAVVPNRLHKACTVAIITAHNYIKGILDLSATSLRDIRRFQIVNNFFKTKYFPAKFKISEVEKPQNENDSDELEEKIVVLSFLVCYYFRLSKSDQRLEVMEIIRDIFQIEVERIKRILEEEYHFLLEKMRLKENIARNNALSENLFCMFVCLLNKIPLIIIGKPGSSKSLALQTIFYNVKGKKSEEKSFFSHFEELVMFSYQGSEYSTSESIETVFSKAEKSIEPGKNQDSRRIPVVVFDEIGLAELSRNNPLKVLHSKLEFENMTVGFVGISNWHLDSSKMNRVLTVARRDPDIHELKITADVISKTIKCYNYPASKKCFACLAQIYNDLKEELRLEGREEIFGLRDFYFLVKQVIPKFNTEAVDDEQIFSGETKRFLFRCVRNSLMRNFSYENDYFTRMWDNFKIKMNDPDLDEMDVQKLQIEELVVSNLKDIESRFMMVVTDDSEVHFKVYEILRNQKKNRNGRIQVMIGSKFEDDIDSQQYCIDQVGQIIMHMENEVILVMHQLDKVYTSLYDLFNQNYRKYGKENYCRVVQGNASKSSFLVHQKFKVILFMTQNELREADGPLINRFEKYSISKDKFVTKEQSQKKNKIDKKMRLLFGNDDKDPRAIRKVIANYSNSTRLQWIKQIDEIDLEMQKNYKKKRPSNTDNEDNEEDERDTFSDAFLQVIGRIANLNYVMYLLNEDKFRNIKIYLENFLNAKQVPFHVTLERLLDAKSKSKSIVYTFSSLFDSINKHLQNVYAKDTDLRKIGVMELTLRVFKNEKDLKNEIKSFLSNPDQKLLLVKIFGKNESGNMYYLQNTISNLFDDTNEENKHCMIIVYHKEGSIADCETFPVSSDWTEYCIDSLFEPLSNEDKALILNPDFKSALVSHEKIMMRKFDEIVDSIFENGVADANNNHMLNKIKKYYSNFNRIYPEDVIKFIIHFCIRICKEDESLKNYKTIFQYARNQNDYFSSSRSILENAKSAVFNLLSSKIANFLKILNNEMLICPLFQYSSTNNKSLMRLWDKLVKITITPTLINTKINQINECTELCYPYSQKEFQIIHEFQIPDDTLEHRNRKNIDDMFEIFMKSEYYGPNGCDITVQDEIELNMLLADLIYLQLSKESENLSEILSIHDTINFFFKNRALDLMKVYVFHPNSASYLIILINTIELILKPKHKKHLEEILKDISNKDLELDDLCIKLIDLLLLKCMQREVFMDIFNELSSKFYDINKYVNAIYDLLDKDLCNYLRFKLCIRMIKLFDNFDKSRDILEFLTKNYNGELVDMENSFDNFKSLMVIINECTVKFKIPHSFNEKVIDFEVFYLNNLIDENIHKNTVLVIQIYDYIFEKIDIVDGFYTTANSSLFKIVKYIELDEKVIKYFQNQDLSAEDDPYFDWFGRSIAKYSKRLPYLIIAIMTDRISEQINESKTIELNAELISSVIERFRTFSNNQELSLQLICDISMVRYLMHYITESYEDSKDVGCLNQIRRVLSDEKTFARSLNMYFFKHIKQNKNLNFEKLHQFFSKTNEIELFNKYFPDYKPGAIIYFENIQFLVLRSENLFIQMHSYFKNLRTSVDSNITNCIQLLSSNKSSVGDLSFYYSIINHFYGAGKVDRDLQNRYLQSFRTNEMAFRNLLGKMGYAFILKILEDFHEDSPFHQKLNTTPQILKRNINVLNAFAVLLSQHDQNGYVRSLFFQDNGREQTDLISHLSQSYLPGMIRSPESEIEHLFDVYSHIKYSWSVEFRYPGCTPKKKIYKCQANCNFYFYFKKSGLPNEEENRNCPLCGNPIGATGFGEGKELSRHLSLSKDEGLRKIEDLLNEFRSSYGKGYFNPQLDINQAIKHGSNVDIGVTNILNFVSNSMVLVINNLGLHNNQLDGLIKHDNLNRLMLGKIQANYDFISANFEKVDPSILINATLAEIGQKMFCIPDDGTSLQGYYSFERNLENLIIRQFMNNYEVQLNKYRSAESELTRSEDDRQLPIAIMEERTIPNPLKYPSLIHLRLSQEKMELRTFIKKFKQKSIEDQNNFPITKFIFENQSELENLKIILEFKKYYDLFREEFNGKYDREYAHELSISALLKQDKNAKFVEPLKLFIDSWNRFSTRNENKGVRKINDSDKLIRIIPSQNEREEGSDINSVFESLIKLQNKMISLLSRESRKTSSQLLGWRNISEKTIFKFDIIELNQVVNTNCFSSFCDYGDLGISVINFSRFEREMAEKVSSYNLLIEGPEIVPSFKFSFESENFSELLANLKNSSYQEPLDKIDVEKYTSLLNRCHEKNRQNFFASLFFFLESILIPRAVFAGQGDSDYIVNNFVKETTSQKVSESSPLKQDFSELKMRHVYSFTLLVESLLFKNNFLDLENSNTKFEKDLKNKDWICLKKTHVDQMLTCPTFKDESFYFLNALGRLIVRSAYKEKDFDYRLNTLLLIDTLYELNFTKEKRIKYEIHDNIKLKHALLLYKEIENERRKGSIIISSVVNKQFGKKVDPEDQNRDKNNKAKKITRIRN